MFDENTPHWFPMRIRHASLSRLETMLSRLDGQPDIEEAYAPTAFIQLNRTKMDFVPTLLNYVFVRATFSKLVKVKSSQEQFEPLRFVMHPVYDDRYDRHSEALYISDKQMDDYKRITKENNDKVIFLDNLSYACRPSQMVQITEGEFTGVVGRIKRIGGVRCVVMPIGHELAPAILDVRRKHLRYLTDEEIAKLEIK